MPVHYTGTETLELLLEAHNYTTDLIRRVLRATAPQQTCLDFGAGLGTFALPLKKAGRMVECIEPDLALLATLRAKRLNVYNSVVALRGQIFDCIY
ncbi:MAG: hypothetical protein V1895_03325, partial [Parcubacteria group bacterium]